jgi:SagB-type dehydrogenase family enzyme
VSTGRYFTARSDSHGLVVSFDDGTHRQYDDPTVAADLLSILDRQPHTTPVFTAAAVASFAEAEQAAPRPVNEGPILQRAIRQTRPNGAETLPLGTISTDRSDPFAAVLERRRSDRDLGPFDLRDLATVLVRSARMITWTYDSRGVETSYRPYPSAGALHPLSLEIIAFQVKGLPEGCWEFDPFRCQLVRARRAQRLADRASAGICDAARRPNIPAAILILANPARTFSRYPSGTAHLWRDVGVLLATLHLAATDIGLGSAIIGTSGVLESFDRRSTGTVDVGALIIGTPAGSSTSG